MQRTFPSAAAWEAMIPPLIESAAEPPRRRILIVDDDRENLRYVANTLKDHGYQMYVADSGELAIEIARQVRLDLVLLDIRMERGWDGVETCRRLKALDASRGVPVVFLTGSRDEDTIIRALDAGGADYVVKPFAPRVLLARVRTQCELGVLSRNLALSLAERSAELSATNDRLRHLAMEITLVEERERRRLATELHDGPMQKLALAQMHIRYAAKSLDAEPGERLDAGLNLMREALDELRSVQFDLSPPLLYQAGLAPALRWLASHTKEEFGIDVSFAESESNPELCKDLAVVLFQCARELVCNVVKHAEATAGRIELVCRGGDVLLMVIDNGRGFPGAKNSLGPSVNSGYGLFSIRERLAVLGGTLAIDSNASGTRASIRVPLAAGPRCGSVRNEGDVVPDERSRTTAAG